MFTLGVCGNEYYSAGHTNAFASYANTLGMLGATLGAGSLTGTKIMRYNMMPQLM